MRNFDKSTICTTYRTQCVCLPSIPCSCLLRAHSLLGLASVSSPQHVFPHNLLRSSPLLFCLIQLYYHHYIGLTLKRKGYTLTEILIVAQNTSPIKGCASWSKMPLVITENDTLAAFKNKPKTWLKSTNIAYVTVDGPVTMPPIDYAPWLLGQEEIPFSTTHLTSYFQQSMIEQLELLSLRSHLTCASCLCNCVSSYMIPLR